jgi:predicted SprT family Zn-dependent metalloprotease
LGIQADPSGSRRTKRRPASPVGIPGSAGPLLAHLSALWGIPDLRRRTRIVPSSRMTRALARAYPSTGTIRISTRVLESGSDDLIREVLCHEAAHLACRMRHGRRVRPHGREWRDLMRQTGYQPRVRFAYEATRLPPSPGRRPLVYEHRCPNCGWRQMARTTNRRWRCAACVRAGREGVLQVTRDPDLHPEFERI